MSSSPKIARKWMPEEDQRLRSILATIGVGTDINWHHVASHIPGRNNKECRKRWIYALMPTLRKGPWNDDEDKLLLKGVALHGLKWPLVSQTVGTRQPDQCSRRWHESLNPNINHGRWSLFEDQILQEAVQTYGRRWTEIVERYFPNRTPIAAKKRYAQCYQTKVKQPKSESDPESSTTSIGQRIVPPISPTITFKKEEPESSSQLLWCVPDHNQQQQQQQGQEQHHHQQQGNFSSTHSQPVSTLQTTTPRYISEASVSTTVHPLVNQYPNNFDLTGISASHVAFAPTDVPHYSPTYSRDDSLGGTSIAEYPIAASISSEAHIWMPTESQSAYSGSPFLFHDTGYFDPRYVTGPVHNHARGPLT